MGRGLWPESVGPRAARGEINKVRRRPRRPEAAVNSPDLVTGGRAGAGLVGEGRGGGGGELMGWVEVGDGRDKAMRTQTT